MPKVARPPVALDGAHSSAMPVVPWASVTTWRPSAGAAAVGMPTMPVTRIGAPPTSSDVYMTRYRVASATWAFSHGW
jgi:hypothetical protein